MEPKYYNELIRIINIDKNKNIFNRNFQNYKTNKFLDFNFSNDNSEADENKKGFDDEENKKGKIESKKTDVSKQQKNANQ